MIKRIFSLVVLALILPDQLVATPPREPSERVLQGTGGATGDFDQINQILAGVTLRINETTVEVGDSDGGILSFIDLNMEFDATEQVEQLLEDTVIEIPSDALSFGGRRTRRQLDKGSSRDSKGGKSSSEDSNMEPRYECPANRIETARVRTFSSGGDGFLKVASSNLELTFGKEINLLLDDFELDDTCVPVDSFGGRRSLLSEAPSQSLFFDELSLTFGKELSKFIGQFRVAVPDFEQRSPIDVLGVTFNLDLTVSNIKCEDFALKQLQTIVDNNGVGFIGFDSLDLSLSASARSLEATCSGMVSYGVGMPAAQGAFKATVVGDVFDLELSYTRGDLSVDTCATRVSIKDVDLSDVKILFVDLSSEFVNGIFDLVDDVMLEYLEDTVNPCKYGTRYTRQTDVMRSYQP